MHQIIHTTPMSLPELIDTLNKLNPVLGHITQYTPNAYNDEVYRLKYDDDWYDEERSLVGFSTVTRLDGPSYDIETYDIFFSICRTGEERHRKDDFYCIRDFTLIFGKSPSDIKYIDYPECKSKTPCETIDPWCETCRGPLDQASDLFDLLNDSMNGKTFKFNDIPTHCIVDIIKTAGQIDWKNKEHISFIQKTVAESKEELLHLREKVANHDVSMTEHAKTYDAKLQECYKEAEKRHISQFASENLALRMTHARDLERISYIEKLDAALFDRSIKAEKDSKIAEKKEMEQKIANIIAKQQSLILEQEKLKKEEVTLAELLAKMS